MVSWVTEIKSSVSCCRILKGVYNKNPFKIMAHLVIQHLKNQTTPSTRFPGENCESGRQSLE